MLVIRARLLGDAENIAPNLVSYINGFSPTARSIFERFKFADQIEKLDTNSIVLGDTLGDGKTRDGFEGKRFHYMLANPPFDVEKTRPRSATRSRSTGISTSTSRRVRWRRSRRTSRSSKGRSPGC